jgi:hypothetical protein
MAWRVCHTREFQKFSLIIQNSEADVLLKKSGKNRLSQVFTLYAYWAKRLPARINSSSCEDKSFLYFHAALLDSFKNLEVPP